MSATQIDLGNDLTAVLQSLNQPLQQSVREMIVLELYRRSTISSGKAAELLGMPRMAFVEYASRLGIPYFDMTKEEWDSELRRLQKL